MDLGVGHPFAPFGHMGGIFNAMVGHFERQVGGIFDALVGLRFETN